MKILKSFLIISFAIVLFACKDSAKYVTKFETDKSGYKYEYVTNDPMETRIYTLKNGLKVYLSKNTETPRIQTLIAVKAGSTYDPSETTGLAHYLEHMMFKGTSKIGTTDWEKESKLIEEISYLYEQYRTTFDDTRKKDIYHKIDSISAIAATYAVANEYDKLVSLIGATNTNAYTSNEETVYMNDIPSNELERWLMIESERFGELVLRLFHTELEAVYEEFNMSQDNDGRKTIYALYGAMFPTHPYGTQTTLGKGEHLKNPSMINIHNYFNTYYVPNNMAICMSGDLDYEATISLIDKYWGKFESKDVKKNEFEKQNPIVEPIEKSVVGPEAEYMYLAYRFNGENSDDQKYVTLINSLLYNGKAGLIDLNLVQKQKVLSAYAYPDFMIDYGMHTIYATPRQNQNLEDVKTLLLEQIEKIKKGEFEDWMLEAAINNYRLSQIRSLESNRRAHMMVSSFISSRTWEKSVGYIDELEKITKQDLIDFANKNYLNNYVAIYKKTGQDSSAMKVDKPAITPININRNNKSEFYTTLLETKSSSLEPVYVDFEKELIEEKINKNVPLYCVKNPINEIFTLQYIFDIGENQNKKLAIATGLLPYLGTSKYTAEQFQQELYKLGLSFGVWTNDNRTYVYISGLDKSFDKGVELLEDILNNVIPDEKAYNDYVDGIIKERKDAKLDKDVILWNGMLNYAKYGSKSPFTDIISENDLKNIKPEELTNLIKTLPNYKPTIYYYGIDNKDSVTNIISKHHKFPEKYTENPAQVIYPELNNGGNVYFVNYDMVQTNLIMVSKCEKLNTKLIPDISLFNEYFGGGMASVVFQEIREAKALAYSAYASYSTPSRVDESHYLTSFIATQVDKLKIASDAMLDLMNNMPKNQKSFDEARENIIKKYETTRITKKSLFNYYLSLKDKGINYDYRKDIYEKAKNATFEDFNAFYEKNIKNKSFDYLIIADKKKIDHNVMSKLGKIKELTLEEIFNY